MKCTFIGFVSAKVPSRRKIPAAEIGCWPIWGLCWLLFRTVDFTKEQMGIRHWRTSQRLVGETRTRARGSKLRAQRCWETWPNQIPWMKNVTDVGWEIVRVTLERQSWRKLFATVDLIRSDATKHLEHTVTLKVNMFGGDGTLRIFPSPLSPPTHTHTPHPLPPLTPS